MGPLGLTFPQLMSFTGVFANPGLGRCNGEGVGRQPGFLGRMVREMGHMRQEIDRIRQDLAGLGGGFGSGPGMGGGGFGSGFGGGLGPFASGGLGSFGMGAFGQNSGWPSFGGGYDGFSCPNAQSPWTVSNQGAGKDHIDLGNYTLDLNESNSQWTLTNKATGAKTDISGDPHVVDGSGRWDFKNDTTFQLDDGTRITVHTTPAGNGATLSSELDISKGGQGMRVSGLASGDQDGGLQVTTGLNGYALDAGNIGDQILYEQRNGWQTFDGFNVNAAVAARENL